MVNFNQTIQSRYGVDTYQATKNNYDWLLNAIKSQNYPDLEIGEDFSFKTGKIGCHCQSLKEFTEYAYEQDNYSLTSMTLSLYFKDDEFIYINVNHAGEVYVSAKDKFLLIKLIEAFESTDISSFETIDPVPVTYIENQSNSVIVQGDNNNVANVDSVVEVTPSSPQTPKWKQHLEAIIQNIMANGIWCVITAIITALVTYFIAKNG